MQRTTKECQSIVFKLSVKFGVPPREIMEKLLSDDDKKDMMDGSLDVETLEAHTEAWVKSGKRDLVGRPKPIPEPPPENKVVLRKPFLSRVEFTQGKE